ncbi:glycosyl transferase family 2, partial [Halorubrum sp. AD140]|nr:glycosyl transferase family 2 [Halorubrum sp. AD140]
DVDYGGLTERYREAAETLVDGYATDAAFNGLSYDPDDERSQVATYAEALGEPGPDTRLPAWGNAPVDPDEVHEAAREDLEAVRGSGRLDGSPTGDAQAEPAPGED